jgi:fructosamine-3-kinase
VSVWAAVARQIGELTGEPFAPAPPQSLGGGCINAAARLSDGDRRFFVKVNAADRLDMFEAERDGLDELASAEAIRVPIAIAVGSDRAQSWLILEDIDFGRPGTGSARRAGRALAALHRHTAPAFGWRRDNTIGATLQPNDWTDTWTDFWREHRLGFQLRLAADRGHGGRLQHLGERLLMRFDTLIDHAPPASLLHGDLWGGNIGYAPDGEPVIYDPAVYYGDREADVAMTELFGGFGSDFYAAYREAWPLDAGYAVRRTLYNLYHVLNHLNLFGGGYGAQAEEMMQRLLAEIG